MKHSLNRDKSIGFILTLGFYHLYIYNNFYMKAQSFCSREDIKIFKYAQLSNLWNFLSGNIRDIEYWVFLAS